MSHGETMEQKHRRKVRETLTPLLGDAGALLVSDSLGGTPAEIEGNGNRIAFAVAMAITEKADAARRSVMSEHVSNLLARTPAIVYLDAANLARMDGDNAIADLLMRKAVRASEAT